VKHRLAIAVSLILLSINCFGQNSSVTSPSVVNNNGNLELKSLMLWLIDPAADAIWDSVSTIIDRSGTKEIRPKNDEEWEALRQQAAVLTEAANLLMMPERVRTGKIWPLAAKKLKTSGAMALEATVKQDVDLLFKAGEEIYKACAGCHSAYTHFDSSASKPLLEKDYYFSLKDSQRLLAQVKNHL
jgi:hypothetical protein